MGQNKNIIAIGIIATFLVWLLLIAAVVGAFILPQLTSKGPSVQRTVEITEEATLAPEASPTPKSRRKSTPTPQATPTEEPTLPPEGEGGGYAVPTTAPERPIPPSLESMEKTFRKIYKEDAPSVVHIIVKEKGEGPDFELPTPGVPMPTPPSPYSYAEGSGFVLDKQGHIVTNYHVVGDAVKVTVIFYDKTEVQAKIIGTDPHSDIAVIKVNPHKAHLKPLPLGDSDKLQVGDLVLTIGNPFGETWTMTHGIISALGRTEKSGNTPFSIPKMIQTDAPINPGNSGGPLLDIYGRAIGINTMILSPVRASSGVGFAIPINLVKEIVPDLITKGTHEYAWVGISGMTVSEEQLRAMGLPENIKGAIVIEVVPNSPADKAGLEGSHKEEFEGDEIEVGGDIIVAIDGHKIETMDDLIEYIAQAKRPGDKAVFTVIRHGKRKKITIILGKRPRSLEELEKKKP